jgi:hypothetical protein
MADITAEQRRALRELAKIIDGSTYLAGGVAIALRLHHRTSRDLDLFVPSTDPSALAPLLPQSTMRILSRAAGTLHLEVCSVPTSLLHYRYPLLHPPETLPGIPLPVASLDDLECMKLSAIAGRGALRDFWDLHAMLTARGRTLSEALTNYAQKFAIEDLGHVVRSLVYFDDAASEPTLTGLTAEHWARIQADFEAWVRGL